MTIRMGIVDDSPETLDVLQMIYRSRSEFEVVSTASEAEQVMEMVERSHLDLVSLDIELGAESGFSVCKELRAAYPHLFIVMCSVEADDTVQRRAKSAGANHFIAKPFFASELRSLIRAYRKFEGTEAIVSRLSPANSWADDLLAAL